MTTEAQLAANRRNATKSTGPRTPGGKALAALNAMQHGLLSRESLVQGESQADLVAFGKRLRAHLAPADELELLLADRIVSTAWRLRRAVNLETRLFNDQHADDEVLETVFSYRSDRDRLQNLSRYEATLERSFYKALHELQRLQAVRAGQDVPPPAVVDLEISVTGPNDAGEMASFGKKHIIDRRDRQAAPGN